MFDEANRRNKLTISCFINHAIHIIPFLKSGDCEHYVETCDGSLHHPDTRALYISRDIHSHCFRMRVFTPVDYKHPPFSTSFTIEKALETPHFFETSDDALAYMWSHRLYKNSKTFPIVCTPVIMNKSDHELGHEPIWASLQICLV